MISALRLILGAARIWKLVPLMLLVSCAINDGNQAGEWRIVRQHKLPLVSFAETAVGQQPGQTFRTVGLQGWLDRSGTWRIKAEVQHSRLRCAAYETGIHLGRGRPACSNVSWLTPVEYVTRMKHCNSAARVHTGGGVFSDRATDIGDISCVRFVVRCRRAC
jgi:hypothetical protein